MNDTYLSAEGALRNIQAQARYVFTPEEFARLTGRQPGSPAANAALWRLRAARRIVSVLKRPAKWLIVPPEHEHFGAPPVDWWLHDCLFDVAPDYYVGLLSAARHWGSSHYARQTTQVMVNSRRVNQTIGKLRIEYIWKSHTEQTPVVEATTQVSRLRVSTREATLLDLIRHQELIGGLEAIARVTHDFRDHLSAPALLAALNAMGQAPPAQRLGVIFEILHHEEMANQVRAWLDKRTLRTIILEGTGAGGENKRQTNKRWSVSYIPSQLQALEELT
jgi:hypothetical protein